ncbi:MAG: hypothetical protein Q9M39_00280 [Sulfurovum sp.]|nr:hypothetical protein [Sulfurovum sp.]
MLVLEDNLLDEIIAYDLKSNYDEVLVSKILNHFKPCITSEWQLGNLDYLDDEILRKLVNTPLINRIEEDLNSFEALVKESHLKLMLVTSIDKTKKIKQIDITEDGLEVVFSQTYSKKDKKREDIRLYIKDLLADKKEIKIKDKYFLKEWKKNSKILDDILPQNGSLEVFVDFSETNDLELKLAQSELKKMRKSMNIDIKAYPNNLHDRYIIAEDLEIVLSSGFLNLGNNSKDLTYSVRIKVLTQS